MIGKSTLVQPVTYATHSLQIGTHNQFKAKKSSPPNNAGSLCVHDRIYSVQI